MRLHSLCAFLTTCLFALGHLSCSEGDFGGIAGNSKSKKKKSDVEEEEGEDELSEPSEVAGAFLTQIKCEVIDEGDEVSMQYGCAVKYAGKKFKVADLDRVSWSHTDAFYRPIAESEFVDQVPASPFHVILTTSAKKAHDSKVEVEMEKDGSVLTRSQVLENTSFQELEIEGQESQEIELGESQDFRIGDGSFNPSKNSDCSILELQKAISGKKMTIPFTVTKANSPISIELFDICGVRYLSNHVAITKGLVPIKTGTLLPWSDSFGFEAMNFAEGDYLIHIESRYNSGQKERDDIVVGGVRLRGLNFTVGEPTAFE